MEILGPGCEAIALAFDYFTDRPEPSAEPAPYSATLEIKIAKGSDSLDIQREGNFSYGKLVASTEKIATDQGLRFLEQEVGRLLEQSGLHQLQGFALGLPSGL